MNGGAPPALALLDLADALGLVADRLDDRGGLGDRRRASRAGGSTVLACTCPRTASSKLVEAGGGSAKDDALLEGGAETLGPLPLPPSRQSSPSVGWGVGWGVGGG